MEVTVVLTNYKRPKNLPGIIKAFQGQTVRPDKIIVVDNSPPPPSDSPAKVFGAESDCDCHKFDEADEVIRLRNDAGPCCRFVAAPLVTAPLVLFYDDDMEPGPKAIEHLLTCAMECRYEFATIGEIGRRIGAGPEGPALVRRNVSRSESDLTVVDVTCRAHLVQTRLWYAVEYARTASRFSGASDAEMRHDDIFMSLGIQMASGWPSYLTVKAEDQATRLRWRDLDDAHANNARPGHNDSRSALVNRIIDLGWRRPREWTA